MVLGFIVFSINTVVAPRFSELFSEGKIDDLVFLYKKTMKMIMFLSIPPVLLLIFFSKQILSIFGSEYTNTYIILNVLVLGQLFRSVFGPATFMLQMTNNEKLLFLSTFFGVSSLLVSGVILIPTYGALGASIATTLCWIITFSMSFFCARKVIARII